jgi:hypothetical protein
LNVIEAEPSASLHHQTSKFDLARDGKADRPLTENPMEDQ